MLNETPDMSQYEINENLNDGWDVNFQFETRMNGEVLDPSAPPAAPVFNRRQAAADPNWLNQYLYENLNEVYKEPLQQTQPLNDLAGPVNESLTDADVVSVALFEKINSRAFMGLASSVDVNKLQGGV